jgi:hypothetical protein
MVTWPAVPAPDGDVAWYTCAWWWRGLLYLCLMVTWPDIPVPDGDVTCCTCAWWWRGLLYLCQEPVALQCLQFPCLIELFLSVPFCK